MESRYANVRDADLRGSLAEIFRARYLALGLSLFLAMYVATKFVLVIFNATDPGERRQDRLIKSKSGDLAGQRCFAACRCRSLACTGARR